jgi:hypothetical protein
MLKFKKDRVRRFAPSPVSVLDKFPHGEKFFSPYGKNLSPCGKFNDIAAKHKIICDFHRVGTVQG